MSDLVDERTILCENKAKWFDVELFDLKNEKIRLYSTAKITNNGTDFDEYKRVRNKYNEMIKIKRNKHISDLIMENANDQKKMWKCLKQIINSKPNEINEMCYNGVSVIDKMDIANMFNEYLINSVIDINNTILNIPYTIDGLYWCANRLVLEHIDLDELNEIIKSFPNKISHRNLLNLLVIRDASEYIGYFLVHIINESFTSGIFPSQWKHSVIFPIPKVAGAKEAEQFRGINTLPIHEKIIETCVHRQLTEHINNNNILMERQSGFRANHSCETALNLIIDEWKISIAKSKVVIAVFLDFKRAFETIDRKTD